MLLNAPPGHAIFWSSVDGKPYPVSLRVLSFEQAYSRLDPHYDRDAIPTFAATLRTNVCHRPENAFLSLSPHDDLDENDPEPLGWEDENDREYQALESLMFRL